MENRPPMGAGMENRPPMGAREVHSLAAIATSTNMNLWEMLVQQ